MITKPYFEVPEGDGSNDEEVAAAQWLKYGLREDSEVGAFGCWLLVVGWWLVVGAFQCWLLVGWLTD